MPPDAEPLPAALAAGVAGLLEDLGITAPHIAGNSPGGWVALELARIFPAASVTLLSPAGLWRGGTPLYCRASLRASRWRSCYLGELPPGSHSGTLPGCGHVPMADNPGAVTALITAAAARGMPAGDRSGGFVSQHGAGPQ